jgi:AcrR family transcriptional regulator
MRADESSGGPEALIALALLGDTQAAEPELTASDVKILDATMYVLGTHGQQALTIDLVAKRAQMSRKTVFRRFGSKQNLLDAANRRGLATVLQDVAQKARAATTALECATSVAASLVLHATKMPAVLRFVQVEPETVIHLWRDGDRPGQTLGRVFLSHLLQDRHLEDPLSPRHADLVADALIRLVMSLVLVPDAGYVDASCGGREPYLEAIIGPLILKDSSLT